MKGRGMYFYALKEDFMESIKELEKKMEGLLYIKDEIVYDKSEFKIYESIEELPDIGKIRMGTFDDVFYDQWRYFVIKKGEEFEYEEFKMKSGKYRYDLINTKGTIIFKPSGIYVDTNCVIKGEITTISEEVSAQLLFKEFKKALLKNMVNVAGGMYVGKSVIENKERYRLVYGSPQSPKEYDLDLSDVYWKEKGGKKK
ncbi:hypothetical protein EII29_10950 [Leptotrichia sp. OH3620_COT-345]|uniref:hypothetical protein n=1 Tax=Leptotrichia sp. OH3620_COT-345 TaxID=2491048 RepID=UPI000F64FDEF|nr:hypothetical protein [Leptotrichia sp. OH3620_COT-345]RRD37924.1 hypothetical protein EII29_10950 [Leptotrichia sp. OH3620_COT-345]